MPPASHPFCLEPPIRHLQLPVICKFNIKLLNWLFGKVLTKRDLLAVLTKNTPSRNLRFEVCGNDLTI